MAIRLLHLWDFLKGLTSSKATISRHHGTATADEAGFPTMPLNFTHQKNKTLGPLLSRHNFQQNRKRVYHRCRDVRPWCAAKTVGGLSIFKCPGVWPSPRQVWGSRISSPSNHNKFPIEICSLRVKKGDCHAAALLLPYCLWSFEKKWV